MAPHELLLTGGTVHALDDSDTVAEAILFRNGRVAAIGSDRAVRREASAPEAVDLAGRTVLPGFNDAHTHLLSVGIDLLEPNLGDATDRNEAIALLAEAAGERESHEWIVGYKYDESTWPPGDRRLLTREDLDAVSTDRPVAAVRVDGHAVSVNSFGLERLELSDVQRDVRTDEDARPTGVLVEDAAGKVKQSTLPTGAEALRLLHASIAEHHRHGITSVGHMAGVTAPSPIASPIHRALFHVWRNGTLDLRVTFYAHGNALDARSRLSFPSGLGDDRLRLGGVKLFADGSIGAQTAKLHGEYVTTPGENGSWVTRPDTLHDRFESAAREDLGIATHALGDRAIDTVLDGYEAVRHEYSIDPRLRIEHFELASDRAIERAAEANVIASTQPNFLQWAVPESVYETALGAEGRRNNNRYRDILDAGVTLAFGSDAMPIGPLYGIHHAVDAEYSSQRISVREALHAYTRGAAFAEGIEEEKGALVEGMLGDAAVLDTDPLQTSRPIKDIAVEMTVFDGRVVFDRALDT